MKTSSIGLRVFLLACVIAATTLTYRSFAQGQAKDANRAHEPNDTEVLIRFKKGNNNHDVEIGVNQAEFEKALKNHSKDHKAWKQMTFDRQPIKDPPSLNNMKTSEVTPAETSPTATPHLTGVHVSQRVGFENAAAAGRFLEEIQVKKTPSPAP